MKKQLILFILILVCTKSKAQELFVLTEPASNMAAKSLGVRVMNQFMKNKLDKTLNFHTMPEIMWGINKNWMVHAQGFISNRNNQLVTEGGSLYAKYRFLSKDEVHSHFRMAVYGRISNNNSDIHQEELEIMGHNTGYETGIIATQLLHKTAISSSVSVERVFNNGSINKFPSSYNNTAVNYTLSVGKLMLPKEYTSYNQTNMNVMLELLGQTLMQNKRSFVDAALFTQFIIKSVARIDIGYRKQLYSNMLRTAPDGFIIKLEYNFFNVLR